MSIDEQSGNLAGETTEMMSEPVTHQNEELRKRRSTRIMQAVPLSVTGVDALGRPFSERTSTLIINCHGCRYQSRHYVLKNMWVTLEVPNAEANQPPRSVRGRVAWIQRPRTVRQLFQVALELERPGNTWGIAFPPPDWFPAQAAADASPVSESVASPDSSARPSELAEIHLPLNESEPDTAAQDNLRIFPAPANATDASLQLARQMARLVADAKQQIQAAAREFAAQAVSAEHRVSLEDWERKVTSAREQLSQQINAALETIRLEADSRSRSAHTAAAEALQRELPRWIAPQLEELATSLTRQISNSAVAERAEHSRLVSSASGSLRALLEQVELSSSQVRSQAEAAQAQLASKSAEAIREVAEATRQSDVATAAHREALASSAAEAQSRLTAATSSAQSAFQSQLQADIESARSQLRESFESTLSSTRENAASALEEHLRRVSAQLHEDAARHAAALRDTASSAATNAEQRFAESRSALQQDSARYSASLMDITAGAAAQLEDRVRAYSIQIQDEAARQVTAANDALAIAASDAELRAAVLRRSIEQHSQDLDAASTRAIQLADRLDNFSARIETAQAQALSAFVSQVGDVLNLHRNELHRQSESALEDINSRIRSTFVENCQLALSTFDQQVDALVQPHISRTEEAIHRLAGGRSLLDAAMTLQQDRIRTSADEAFAESLARFRENLGGVDQLLQDAADSVTSRNLSEFESRLADLKHHTIDDLMKSAEWYEKKAHTQIQNLTDKTIEQAESHFREKAGEVSSVFASELDHSSRSFIGHTQSQMEEVVRESFERARALFAEAADTTTAAFTDEIQRQARTELDGFNQESLRSLDESRSLLDSAHSNFAQQLTAGQEAFLHKFHAALSGAVDSGVADAHSRVKAGLAPLLESWKSTVDSHASQMREIYSQMGGQAVEQHRSRLENVSNQWLLATVSNLDHQSREAIAGAAAKAEEALRETCAQVFANVGDSLRERLQQIASGFAPRPPQTPPSPQTPSSTDPSSSDPSPSGPPLSRSTSAGSGNG
ncbi:MAG TPA: hypothetical protein VJN93_03980 [Candidatus Acidoferrum sp.]|nr:hypothetical protein [Candidatus Acidoferrum sp.]